MKRFLSPLHSVDFVNLGFLSFCTIALLLWSPVIPYWWGFALGNFAMILGIVTTARAADSKQHGPWMLLHGLIVLACIPLVFREMYFLVPAIHPVDRDSLLIAMDFQVFGVHPTHWIYQFRHPVVTEILQLAYASYYFLPVILALDLYRRKNLEAVRRVFLVVVLGFYLSYLGYIAVPAIGPRFTLHEFSQLEKELPGLLFTEPIRNATNRGESISSTMVHPERVVQRDVFPSGHTQITLLVMILAFQYRSRTRWILLIMGSLLILATVYLRYHYVVDLIGGFLFALATLSLAHVIEKKRRTCCQSSP